MVRAGAGGGAGLCFGPVSLGTAEADTNICSELLYIYFISDLAALSSVLFCSDYLDRIRTATLRVLMHHVLFNALTMQILFCNP